MSGESYFYSESEREPREEYLRRSSVGGWPAIPIGRFSASTKESRVARSRVRRGRKRRKKKKSNIYQDEISTRRNIVATRTVRLPAATCRARDVPLQVSYDMRYHGINERKKKTKQNKKEKGKSTSERYRSNSCDA